MSIEPGEAPTTRRGPENSNGHSGRLKGKVALIVTDTLETIQQLALGLAERGAEVTVVCPQDASDDAAEIGAKIEDLGQRFLFIARPLGVLSAERVVRQVLDAFGHLDIFIDFSRSALPTSGRPTSRRAPETGAEQLFADPQLVKAVLQQLGTS